MHDEAVSAIKLTWSEWLDLAKEQGLFSLKTDTTQTEVSSSKQVQAYHFLHTQLLHYPATPSVQAVIDAYAGSEEDYYAQMLWIKRAHLLEILPTISAEELSQVPSVHQIHIRQARKERNFDVEGLWQVAQDLICWRKKKAEEENRKDSLSSLAENAPVFTPDQETYHIDQAKSYERWNEMKQLRGELS